MKLYKRCAFFLLLSVLFIPLFPNRQWMSHSVAASGLASSWVDTDIGSVGLAGSASVTGGGVFSISGSGADIYYSADAFHFAYQPLSGDGSILARVLSVQGGSGYVTAGVMIRETLTPGSTNAKTADWAGYQRIYFDVRAVTGGGTGEPGNVGATLPYWVKVSRSGSTFTSYASPDGGNWTQLGASQTISMAQNVYVGLAVNSGSTTATATATFDNVSLTQPAPPTPNFSLSASPSGVTVTQGASGTSSVTVIPQNGFNGSVSLSASGLPSGVSASFNPASATSTSTLTLTASSTAATGTATVTI